MDDQGNLISIPLETLQNSQVNEAEQRQFLEAYFYQQNQHLHDLSPQNPTTERDSEVKKSHKEIERKRRDTINAGITNLSLLVPGCKDLKKGKIIERSIQYIHELRNSEMKNLEMWSMEKLMFDET